MKAVKGEVEEEDEKSILKQREQSGRVDQRKSRRCVDIGNAPDCTPASGHVKK